MSPTKKQGRIIGILFILIILLGVTSLNFRGLGSSLLESESILQDVFEQGTQMKLAVVLNLMAGLLWLWIAIYLYPYIKNISRTLALWYVALWIIQFGASLMGDLGHLSLIELSRQVQGLSDMELSHYNTIARVQVHDYFWGHFLGLMGYSSATFLLFVAFFRGKWLPAFIPIWGMAAMTSVFTASLVQLFDIEVSFWFYQQNGFHFIFMTLWLLIFGFRSNSSLHSQ